MYLMIFGGLIAAGIPFTEEKYQDVPSEFRNFTGCAFEMAYGSRGSSGRTIAHVASRNAPYAVRTA